MSLSLSTTGGPENSAGRFRDLGVDVYFGEARFGGSDTVTVGDQTLRFKRAVVASGTRAPNVHPYPTQADAIRQTGDACNRTRLTPFVKSLFAKYLTWARRRSRARSPRRVEPC